MFEKQKKYKVVGFDKGGPSVDNNFVPSIVVQQDEGDQFCIGFRYNGASSLDTTSYAYDHANRHRGNRSWSMSRKNIENELSESNLDLEKLKKDYVKRIGKV